MMKKEPRPVGLVKSGAKFGLSGIIIAELTFACVAYFYWRKMNHSQDYRYNMYQNNPKILKAYYWTSSMLGYDGIKDEDYKAWGVHFNKKVEKLY